MSESRDWRAAYQGHMRMRIEQLTAARARGETFFRSGDKGVPVNPTKLSDRQIEDLARRDAETVVNRAINKHNERAAAGRLKSAA